MGAGGVAGDVVRLKVGDTVYTSKGCRISGPGGKLIVVKTGLMWHRFKAAKCLKENGKTALFLIKNLYHRYD